jgi:Flp pilus assembly protein TadD
MELLKSLETRAPNAAAIHRALGEAFALSGDPKSSTQELQTAIKLNPRSAESYDDLGKLQLTQGDIASAIVSLEQAVSLQARDGNFHRDLAEAYRKASRVTEAARETRLYEELRHADARRVP